MADYEVTCVTMQPGGSDHYAIESLSGTSDDEPWSFDIAEVVERINIGAVFHLRGSSGRIILAAFGERHVQAYAGGRWMNDLLDLLRCVAEQPARPENVVPLPQPAPPRTKDGDKDPPMQFDPVAADE